MTPKSIICWLTTLIIGCCLLSGCVFSRNQYFSRLRERRAQSYNLWERNAAERKSPRVEGELCLEEAVKLSLRYNKQLLSTLQEKEKARGRITEAYSEVLPKLNLGANYTRLDEVATVDLGVMSFPMGDEDNYSCRVNVTQPLFTGGRAAIAVRTSQLFMFLSDEKVRGALEQVIYGVAESYYSALLAERMIDVQRDALNAARAHLEDVRSRERHGVATEYDVLRARVEVSNFKAELIEQRNRRDQSLKKMFKAMGVSQKSNVNLITEMEYKPVHIDFENAVRKGYKNRPDIYQASLSLDLQKESFKAVRTRYLPDINAFFWHQWAKPDPHSASKIEWGTEWQAGLNLSWPIFDGMAREGKIIQERAALKQKELQLTDAEAQAILEIRAALDNMQNTEELVESQRLNLERADRALNLVNAGYREGINTEVEVLDATAALTRARALYYNALYRHTMARINMQKAMGALGPEPGREGVPEKLPGVGDVTRPEEGKRPN